MTYSSRRYYSIVLLSFLFKVSMLSLPTPQGDATSKSLYDSGHDHGCNDADISDPYDRYINQPEKGPSFHTDEFMRGYNSGYNACSQSSAGGGDDKSNGSAGNNNGSRVIVHMAGVGFACVYSERQDLGCNEVDDPGSIEFVFSEGSVETGEGFTACFKDRENGPFYNVDVYMWRMDQNQSHSIYTQEFLKTIVLYYLPNFQSL
jgi:hypothetical protein